MSSALTAPPRSASWSAAWRPAWRRRSDVLLLTLAWLAVTAATMLAVERDLPQAPEAPVIRLGVVSFYNPRLMYIKYQPLVDYLSSHTRWRFQLALSSSYQKTVDSLCSGEVPIAYLGPFSYLRARETCGVRPVLRLNTAGKPTYRSYIMVRTESRFKTVADLRNTRFGFGARLSTSSHLVPRAMLEDAGLRVGRDVSCRYFAHHDRAARAVLLNEVAASGIRDLVGDQFTSRGLRILAVSDPIPNFPIVLAPGAPKDLEAALTAALVDLPARDPAAARLMAGWDPELAGGFAPTTVDAYRTVRDLARRVLGPRALTAPPDIFKCAPEW